MSTQLETSPNQTFNFFYKTKKLKSVFPSMVTLLLCLSIGVGSHLLMKKENAESLVISNNSQQEYVSAVFQKRIKDLAISLEKKDWENTQYLLMKLSQLKSSKVDADVIGLLSDYATTNFKSKKLPYSNEFSLLSTNYLISTRLLKYESNETVNIKKLELAQTILPGTKEMIKSKLEEAQSNYAQSTRQINSKAKLLIEGLREGKNKKLLSTIFN